MKLLPKTLLMRLLPKAWMRISAALALLTMFILAFPQSQRGTVVAVVVGVAIWIAILAVVMRIAILLTRRIKNWIDNRVRPSMTNCPGGHINGSAQRFCGECGVSLVGVCPKGHPNPDGQRYCGECGSSLGPSRLRIPTSPISGGASTSNADDVIVERTSLTGEPSFGPRMEYKPESPPGSASSAWKSALSGLQHMWSNLPLWGKTVLIVLLVAAATLLVGGGRDDKSYEYGRTTASGWSLPLWAGTLTKPQFTPKIKTARDACSFTVEIARDNETPVEMRNLKDNDIIDGCTDELVRLTGRAGLNP